MLVGAAGQSLSGSDYAVLNASAGPFTCRRSYNGANDFASNHGVPTSFSASNAALDYDTVADMTRYVSVYSFKPDLTMLGSTTGNLDARLEAFIETIPDGHPMMLTPWHEPGSKVRQGTFSAAAWIAGFRRFADVVDASGNAHLYTALIDSAYQPPTGGLYADVWPGNEYVDVMLLDGYTDLGSGNPVWLKGRDFATLKGVPWGIGELGFRTGVVNSDWMAVQANYAQDNGAVCLCWFNSNSGGVSPTPGTAAGPLATARLASTAYKVVPALFEL